MAATQQDHDKNNEKRATRRFALRLPVTVRYEQKEQEHAAQTRDVSARGICFYVDSAIQAGSAIDFTLTLPPEITLTESIRVRCKGRVVRVEGGSPADRWRLQPSLKSTNFWPIDNRRTEFLHIFPGIFLARLSSLPLCVFLAAIPE